MKPGHWYQARQEIKANEENESLTLTLEVGRQSMDPIPLPGGNQFVEFHRDTSIAKGQAKSTELLFYVSPVASLDGPQRHNRSTRSTDAGKAAWTRVTIAEQPFPNCRQTGAIHDLGLEQGSARHTHWGGLSCVVWPSVLVDQSVKISPHRVIALGEKEMVNAFLIEVCFGRRSVISFGMMPTQLADGETATSHLGLDLFWRPK